MRRSALGLPEWRGRPALDVERFGVADAGPLPRCGSGGTANGVKLQLYDCNGTGAQSWVVQSDGSIKNPQSGRCMDSPGGATANGTRLEIWDCNGTAAQKFHKN